jgi:hypothetical protein
MKYPILVLFLKAGTQAQIQSMVFLQGVILDRRSIWYINTYDIYLSSHPSNRTKRRLLHWLDSG